MAKTTPLTLAALALAASLGAWAQQAPIGASETLLEPSQPEDVGLTPAPGTETFTVFAAGENTYQYNHGAVPFAFNGKLFVQWQSSPRDEDSPDTQVRYAMSVDGKHWSDPLILEKPRAGATVTNGGWWAYGDTLVAYINVWPHDMEPRGGHVEYRTSEDGIHWRAPKAVRNDRGEPLKGIIEQDIRALEDGRLVTALHRQPGLIATPIFTDDATGLGGWSTGKMPQRAFKPGISRELEPSWYVRGDELVMIFRDQSASFRVLASVSADRGETWSTPVVTNIPDSRAKQSAGNLPDGSAFIVNNPSGSKARWPLVISTSADGETFDRAWLLRGGGEALPALKFAGRYKRVGYSYPKSTVFEGYVYTAYATGKEDVEVTRVPVTELDYQ